MLKKFFLGVCIVAITLQVWADMYQVSDVAIQADGDNPVQAKQLAITQGQRQGLKKVLRRLLGPNKDYVGEDISDIDLDGYVQDISIQHEKNTPQSYWATLSVRFQSKIVQDYLNTHHQNYLKTEPPIYLIIPVMVKGSQQIGLEDTNLLYQFLRSQDVLSDFYDLKLPSGDLNEVIEVNKALKTGEYQDLVELAKNYGANHLLFVWATSKSEQSWSLNTEVFPKENIHQNVLIEDWYSTITLEDAWYKMLLQMEQNWREIDSEIGMDNNTYYARLTESSLSQWVRDEQNIKKLKFLTNVILQGAYQNQLLISFTFDGSKSELEELWEKAGWHWSSDLTSPSGTLTRKEVYYE